MIICNNRLYLIYSPLFERDTNVTTWVALFILLHLVGISFPPIVIPEENQTRAGFTSIIPGHVVVLFRKQIVKSCEILIVGTPPEKQM